jgi:hypothetical protein
MLVLLFQVIFAQIFVAFASSEDVINGTQDLMSYNNKCLFFTFPSDNATIFSAEIRIFSATGSPSALN